MHTARQDTWSTWRKSSHSGGSDNNNCVEIAWRKSSHSGGSSNNNCVEVAWQKSSYSGGSSNNDCVEVAVGHEVVGVRDSKNATGPALAFPAAHWARFLAGDTRDR